MAVDYDFYTETWGGQLGEAAFLAGLPAALSHVRWLCLLDSDADEDAEAFCRAVCAALDALAEYGAGEVGGYSIGEFSVKNYENKGTTGEELATAAALRELAATGWAFSGPGDEGVPADTQGGATGHDERAGAARQRGVR